jgi:next-to-BRCA1 protein 1
MQAVERQNQMVQEQLDREAREVEEEQQRKARDFWIAQDLAQADKMDQERREAVEQIADAQARLALHIEEEQMRWARAPAVPPPPPPPPAPVQEPASFPSYWPKSSEELRHLMQHDSEPVIDAFSRLSVQEELAEVMDSPLIGEALLNRPVASNSDFSRAHLELVREEAARVTSFNHSLAALLNGYDSETEPDKKDEEPLISITKEEPTPVPTPSIPDLPSVPVLAPAAPSLAPAAVPVPIPVPAPALGLRATFVNDLTLPDGQIFPPGAEFMKCWQMVNSGGVEWPAGTELVYVAGERLAREVGEPKNVPIGSVKVGAEVELWTGELKAPETPGRYVSYWRLRDGQGRLFGESIWIDINVTETRSNESSLSSSSIIVMPRGAQSVPTSSASASASNVRGEVDEDELSEHGSDASSGSLISVPTSDDEEWASVPSEQPAEPQRYVVLYDDTSSQSSGSDIE